MAPARDAVNGTGPNGLNGPTGVNGTNVTNGPGGGSGMAMTNGVVPEGGKPHVVALPTSADQARLLLMVSITG